MSAFGGKADIAPARKMSAHDPKRTCLLCYCMDIVIPLRLREASRPIAGPRTLITTPLVFCSVATLPPPTIASAADPWV